MYYRLKFYNLRGILFNQPLENSCGNDSYIFWSISFISRIVLRKCFRRHFCTLLHEFSTEDKSRLLETWSIIYILSFIYSKAFLRCDIIVLHSDVKTILLKFLSIYLSPQFLQWTKVFLFLWMACWPTYRKFDLLLCDHDLLNFFTLQVTSFMETSTGATNLTYNVIYSLWS